MYYIMFMLIGIITGILLATAIHIEKTDKINEAIKSSDKAINNSLKTILQQWYEILNLENNLEFVTNNLSAQKKKYIGR